MGSATASTAHSVPPAVILTAVGRDRDIAVVTLDLEAGAIARSMLRRLAGSLFAAKRTFMLQSVAHEPASVEDGGATSVVLGIARSGNAFQIDLTHEAAQQLHDELGRALGDAETECATDGCSAIALIDGHCAADNERLARRIGGAA
ncbi:hypothetical protein [Phycicoccus jejuensis]|uniref:hypothetical protein n=1 Tax=Phycicoccus jejuensis TaxID=367299 RepID=UPI0004C3B246|nr:hypothetical protein [Phycicoccus jejuensis]